MSCTLFLCQEAKWTDINQPIVQSYAILLDWQIPTSHITHPHWSQVFTLSLLSRPRFSFSLQSLGAAWRLGMGVRRGLVSPRLFWGRVSRCLWGEAARLLLSSVLCSVQCQHPSASRTIIVVPILAIQDPDITYRLIFDQVFQNTSLKITLKFINRQPIKINNLYKVKIYQNIRVSFCISKNASV